MTRLACIALFVALGCEHAAPEPTEPTELRVKDTQLFGEPAPEPDEVQVELIDPGREPQKVLRYRPEPGSEQTVTLEHKSDMDWFSSGQRVMTRKPPPARNRVKVRVLEVTEAGDIRAKLEILQSQHVDFNKMGSSGGEGALISLDELVGYTFDTTISGRGHVRGKDFMLRDEVPSEIFLHAMQIVPMLADTLTIPLPEEAVGAGASWRATRSSSYNGVDASGVFTYHLESVELDRSGEPARLRLRSEIAYRAEPQLVADDIVMVMQSFDATGREEMELSLSGLARSQWRHFSDTSMVMTLRLWATQPDLTMKVSVNLSSTDR